MIPDFVWWILIIGSFFGLIEAIFLFASLVGIGESYGMRKSLFFIFLCNIITISYNTLIGIFGLINLNMEHNLWLIISIAIIFNCIFFTIFTKLLKDSIQKIQEIKQKEPEAKTEEED